MSRPNKSVKPFAALLLTQMPSTPRLIAHGFAIVAQKALHAGRRLPRR